MFDFIVDCYQPSWIKARILLLCKAKVHVLVLLISKPIFHAWFKCKPYVAWNRETSMYF
jgi:hypothetical protein